ncbi:MULTISPECIES: hypothetical protein [Butyricimonas]|jgi:hypothetical protein|uniref:hypothetical protein n=1 Tax=Butyricimonas TaxID=574697 RepID=UPI00242E29C6|nr:MULTISPECIES: hypothetical protein [Butyricimonas]
MITRVNISFFRYHSKETGTGEAPRYQTLVGKQGGTSRPSWYPYHSFQAEKAV